MVDVAVNDALDTAQEASSVAELSPVSKEAADSVVSEQTEVHSEGMNGGFAAEEAAGITANGGANGGLHDVHDAASLDTEVTAEAGACKNGEEAEEEGPPEEEEKWRKRLYFVRMPKPPEDAAVLALDQEFESLRVQHNLLSETMNIKKLEKDAAISNLRNAQDAVNRCIEALKAKDEQLLPLKQLRDARKKLAEELASFKDLPAKSEVELERRVAEANHKIEHESLTLNEEKALLKEVKKLSASRDRIKEYTVKNSEMEELKSQIRAMEASLEGVEADRRALRSELEVAKVVRDKFKEEERAVAASMSEVYAERAAIKEVKDAAYNRMADHKSGTRAKVTDFYENRRFSRRVRQLLAEGKLEEARDLCYEQQEEAHAKLNGDEAYRVEYFRLWSQQRVPTFDFSPEELEEAPAGKGARGAKKGAAAAAPADPEEARRRAEAIIAAALAEVSVQVKSGPAAAAPKEPEPVPEPAPVAAAVPVPAAKAKAAKAPGAPLVVVPEASLPAALLEQEDKFQLPDFAKHAAKDASKAREQQQSRDAREKAAEAEARKERRRKAAERRREKAAEAAKAKSEADARAAAEAAAATAAAAAASAAASVPADDDSEPAAGEAPAARAAAAPASQPAKRGGGAKAGAKGGAVASRNTVRTRPPVPKKKGIKAFLKQYEMYLIGAAFLLFVLTIVHISFRW